MAAVAVAVEDHAQHTPTASARHAADQKAAACPILQDREAVVHPHPRRVGREKHSRCYRGSHAVRCGDGNRFHFRFRGRSRRGAVRRRNWGRGDRCRGCGRSGGGRCRGGGCCCCCCRWKNDCLRARLVAGVLYARFAVLADKRARSLPDEGRLVACVVD